MTTPLKPTLRYFDARGRAQFIRYYLRARGVEFTDERVPLSDDFSAWRSLRPDRSRTGPFQRLPVLHWGDRLVAEALVIAEFLHTANGDASRLSDEENLRQRMLVSSLYADVLTPIGILLWADLALPGVDVAAYAPRMLERLRLYLETLDTTLTEWHWLDGIAERPVMLADCLLWEQLDLVQFLFAAHAQLDAFPALTRFYRECPGRTAFEACLAALPCQITGRPNEAEAIGVIRAALAGTSAA